MRTEALNRWLALGANLAVLAGLGLLVLELRQTREMMRAQTRNDVAVELVDLLRDVATDPHLSDLMGRAFAGQELSDPDDRQFRYHTLAYLRYFENVHYQYRHRLYEESEFATQQEAWRGFMTSRGRTPVWCGARDTFSAEFKGAFDDLLPEPC